MPRAVWNSPGLGAYAYLAPTAIILCRPNHLYIRSLSLGGAGLIKEIKRPEVIEVREDAAFFL